MGGNDVVTVRIDTNTKAALDMVAAKFKLRTGKNVTLSQAIWILIEDAAPDVAEIVREQIKENKKGK